VSNLTYRSELDGLRSIAVYLVLVFHAGMATFSGGFVGVDLFFVLSGFLVTGIILREVDERGTFSLGGFYSRRVRRLLPAAVLAVVGTAAVQVLLASLPARVGMVPDARASLLYYANWHFIGESRDYFARDDAASPYLHFWSLAIEEQFYIVYPLLVLLLLRVARRPVRALVVVLTVVLTGSVVLQLWRATDNATYAYYATETRIYQLAAGAVLALVVRAVASRRPPRPVRGPATGLAAGLAARVAAGVAGVGLVALALVASTVVDVSPAVRGLLATAVGVVVVAGLWWSPDGVWSRLLGTSVPRYLGQISYGTYLWHWPVLLALREVLDVRPLVMATLGAVLATGLASLSFTLLERPVRRSPRLGRRGWTVALGGVGVSALVAALVVGPVLEQDRRPALTVAQRSPVGSIGADLDRPVPRDLDLVEAKHDIGPDTEQCTADHVHACTRVEGSGPHVLLLGDSQARSFVPAMERIAREHDLTLSTNVRQGCPWQQGQVNLRDGRDERAACERAREEFFADVLPEMDVDVVLAVGLSRSDAYWESRLAGRGDHGDETLHELQARTTRETAKAVTDAGAELVIARSTFGTGGYGVRGFDPVECLARAHRLADCAVVPPISRPAVDGVYDFLAGSRKRVHTVDLNPVLCPDRPACAPVVDGTVVWRDPDHVTTRFLVDNQRRVWRRLESTGVFA